MFYLIPTLLVYGPLALVVATWVKLARDKLFASLGALTWIALLATTATALYAGFIYIFYTMHPSPELPPWKDPETLDLGLLFLLAPVCSIFSIFAATKGAPKWLVIILLVALAPLFLTGLLEGVSV